MTHFIKLPDGTIINTANITRVEFSPETEYIHARTELHFLLNTQFAINDPDGAIYAYFDNIATAIVAAEESTDDDTELGW